MSTHEPEDAVERALVRIRRDQQAGRLYRAATKDDSTVMPPATAARFRYLDALEDAEHGLAISQVAAAIGVDRPRASRLTADLLGDGLVERRPDPEDARYTLVRLTAQGRSLVAAAHQNRRVAVSEALTGFTPEEAHLFADLLDRFVAAWSSAPSDREDAHPRAARPAPGPTPGRLRGTVLRRP